MRVVGIDTNSHYLALSVIESGLWQGSWLLPAGGPALKKSRTKGSARERLDTMVDELRGWLRPHEGCGPALDYAYIEEPPFVNSIKTFAELTAVVMVTREVFRGHDIPVGLVNVSTWKRETTGNAKADKTEVRQWVQAHAGMPDGLTEDEYDAACIAFRGAVAAGDTR